VGERPSESQVHDYMDTPPGEANFRFWPIDWRAWSRKRTSVQISENERTARGKTALDARADLPGRFLSDKTQVEHVPVERRWL
jgi:hypothetical protein